jgi:hypothetical protein
MGNYEPISGAVMFTGAPKAEKSVILVAVTCPGAASDRDETTL